MFCGRRAIRNPRQGMYLRVGPAIDSLGFPGHIVFMRTSDSSACLFPSPKRCMKQGGLIFLLAMCLPSWATTYYVLPGGTGTKAGSSWSNARCSIPDPLAAGDTVYIGNVVGQDMANTAVTACAEPTHSFSGSGTSASHITIKAATGADHGSATGWSSSMGVDVNTKITWSNTWVPSNGLKAGFWTFCGNYYDFDGKVGTADSTGTYGFYMKSAGNLFGFIKLDSHDCGETSLTGYTFQNIELDGVEANGTVGGTQSGASAVYAGSPVSTTATVTNLSVTHAYMHDIMDFLASAGDVSGVTYGNLWLYTNFSDAAQHSNAIDCNSSGFTGNATCLSNLTVYSTVFKNIQGTGVIMCLTGQCNNWQIYNNVIYYSSDWDTICEHGDSTATCGMSKGMGDNAGNGTCDASGTAGCVTNSVFYGNTWANIHLKPGHPGADSAGIQMGQTASGGNVAQNNLWWNCTIGPIWTNNKITHDYNRWLNTGITTTVLAAHEFQTGTAPGGGATDPFVNSFSNFQLSSESVDTHLNDGVLLPPPYNVDFAGTTRGGDGTWERGAFEFNSGVTQNPLPPTNLVVSVQ